MTQRLFDCGPFLALTTASEYEASNGLYVSYGFRRQDLGVEMPGEPGVKILIYSKSLVSVAAAEFDGDIREAILGESNIPAREDFMARRFLVQKYHVPADVEQMLNWTAVLLEQKYGERFIGLSMTGDLVNGKYVLNSLESAGSSSWLKNWLFKPFRAQAGLGLLVNGATAQEVKDMWDFASGEMSMIGIRGEANAVFDVAQTQRYIDRRDYRAMSIPFGYTNVLSNVKLRLVQETLASAIQKQADREDLWTSIRFYHDQPLTIGERLPDLVKMERFGLPPIEYFLPLTWSQ